MVPPVRNMLKRASAEFEYIDISRNADARQRVLDINNGNASVPTLVFNDGSTLTEPSGTQLKAALEQRGFAIEELTIASRIGLYLQNPTIGIVGAALLLFGSFQGDATLQIAGSILLIVFAAARLLIR